MKIYLAGPCDTNNRTIMMHAAEVLREECQEVYCPFELKIKSAWSYSQEEWAAKVFDADVAAIKQADVFIYISLGRESTAGSNWEQGYAYALGKPVYVIQITDHPTSLMTYCGCTYFMNSDLRTMNNDLRWLLNKIQDNNFAYYSDECTTILT